MQPQEDGFQNYDLMGVVFILYIYIYVCVCSLVIYNLGWRMGESGPDGVTDEGRCIFSWAGVNVIDIHLYILLSLHWSVSSITAKTKKRKKTSLARGAEHTRKRHQFKHRYPCLIDNV